MNKILGLTEPQTVNHIADLDEPAVFCVESSTFYELGLWPFSSLPEYKRFSGFRTTFTCQNGTERIRMRLTG
jgi:hypothetical protein